MAGKPKATRFGEFRLMVEYMKRGKFRIRPEFQPSIAAYLLMMGNVYQKAIQGMESRLALETVPALEGAVDTLRTCQRHIARLMAVLPQNFDVSDWSLAVAEVTELLGLEPDSPAPADIADGTFTPLIPVPTDGPDASAEPGAVPVRARARAKGATGGRRAGRGRKRAGAGDEG